MRIGIIGCGTIGGGIATRLGGEETLFFYDHHPDRIEHLNGKVCSTLKELLDESEVIFLCIKPHNFEEASPEIYSNLNKKRHFVISVMAGISLETLRNHFGKVPVARIMPNIALATGTGITGIVEDPLLTEEQRGTLSSLTTRFGTTHWIPESKMEALAALTGSGPAFVAVIMESFVDAAIAMGFKATQGQQLTEELLQCTLSLVKEHNWNTSELKRKVSSPAGTTIKGLRKLEEKGLRSALIETLLATKH